jgi:uncharacterized protein (DUF1697 family)
MARARVCRSLSRKAPIRNRGRSTIPVRRTYIALLRGVNVGGNALPMERLRTLCGDLGLNNARTYVQSGNLAFEGEKSAAHWSEELERALAGTARLPISVLVRTGAEVAKLVARNPFLREKGVDPARLYVTFLRERPTNSALVALAAVEAGPDRFSAAGREVYLHCPVGYGRSKLTNNVLERVLKTRATTRNWRTVATLAAMAAE